MTLASSLIVDHPDTSSAVYKQVVLIQVPMCDADVCGKRQRQFSYQLQGVCKGLCAFQLIEAEPLFALHEFNLLRNYLLKHFWRVFKQTVILFSQIEKI